MSEDKKVTVETGAARLTALIREVKKLFEEASRNHWQIAKDLKEIHESQLYLYRYKSWAEFCRFEFNLSDCAANGMIQVYDAFDKSTFVKVGWTKLYELMKIPSKFTR